jgi:hypothetical protein
MLRPFKGLFSRRSRSPSHQPVTPDNGSASRSASPANSTTFSPQVNSRSHLGVQPVTPHNATATSPRNNATSAPEANTQGAEYTAILGLPTMPSGPLTWEHQMKEWGSTAYEGLKMAIQGIYNCSGSFPPLQTTAGVLLTISKVVDVRGSMCSTLLKFNFVHQRVSTNRTDLEQLGVKLQSIISIIRKYGENGGLHALDYRVENFCLYVGSVHACLTLLNTLQGHQPSNRCGRKVAWQLFVDSHPRRYEGCRHGTESL